MAFRDRRDAGWRLASRLAKYKGEADLLVLGIPRGGVPVAADVAQSLQAELDVLIVRKLGVPGHRELAGGAIASGGAMILNYDVLRSCDVNRAEFQSVIEAEQKELKRREILFRGNRPAIRVKGRHLIVVDDGLATGASMEAALTALQSLEPSYITVAVPVASTDALLRIEKLANEVICLLSPNSFVAVGQWYEDFRQIEDEEVQTMLLRPILKSESR